MIVLIGPSASGKTETAKYLMQKHGLGKVVTCTSRAPRTGEKDGVDYHFLTRDQFAAGVARGAFLETAEYNGNLYGTRKADVGPGKVSCIEPQGAHAYKNYLGTRLFCAYLDADENTRMDRMVNIRKDPLADAKQRIARDKVVFAGHGAAAKDVADLVLRTDGLTIAQEAESVYRAYRTWLKTHRE